VRRRLLWLTIYAVAMAYLESAVVVDLRGLYYPNGFEFPLVTPPPTMAAIEIGREAVTLVMLLAVAALCGVDPWERFLAFCIAFGVWDLFYYGWLWVFIRWPPSLLTWDILFLIPVPWMSPVLAPVIISVTLTASALWLWYLKQQGARLRFSPVVWTLVVVGGCLVLASFTLDFELAVTMSTPVPFRWGLFSAGYGLSLIALMRGVFGLRDVVQQLRERPS
jgi:hypothetical protein